MTNPLVVKDEHGRHVTIDGRWPGGCPVNFWHRLNRYHFCNLQRFLTPYV